MRSALDLPLRIALALGCVGVFVIAAVSQTPARWEREFPETVNVVVLQNPAGRTEVEVVAAATIRATAEAAAGAAFDELSVTVDQSAPGVLILRVAESAQVTLRVAIPSRVVLSAQSGSGEITVRGVAARSVVETRTGNIILHLPNGLDADFSFKTMQGQVVSGVELAETAGNTGRKGRPVVHARSDAGNIVLIPWSGPAANVPLTVGLDLGSGASASGAPERRIVRGPLGSRRATDNSPVTLTPRTPPKAAKAPNDGRVRVNSDLVLVNAYVVDPKNSSVADLKKEDFAVKDNQAEQQIAIFEPVNRPLDLLILLDLSGSTHSKFDVVKKAVKKFVDTLAPEDRIAIAAFTSRFIVISDFTNDRKLLKKRMDDTKNRRGGTEFYRSMWNTLDLLAEVDSPRRAIVVMTDGVDNSLQPGVRTNAAVTFEELLERIRNDGISIYPIYLNTEFQMVVKEGSGDSLSYKEAREQLQMIADATGTTMFRADRFEDLAGAYERVAAELRNLYTLGFYPTDRGKEGDWHDLAVRVNRADATVRARKGYFVR